MKVWTEKCEAAYTILPFGMVKIHESPVGQVNNKVARFVSSGCCFMTTGSILASEAVSEDSNNTHRRKKKEERKRMELVSFPLQAPSVS